MRYNVPCQIDLISILRNTFKDFDTTDNENFNFDSFHNVPIIVNNQPIGIMTRDRDYLWLDITPEFIQIDGKWNLSGLNVDLPNKESFKLEYEAVRDNIENYMIDMYE